MSTSDALTPVQRRLFRRRRPQRPSAWAEAQRVLAGEINDLGGPLRHAEAPYLVGLMDLLVLAPWVQEIWVEKAAQVGVSEALRSVIGWLADMHPGPLMFILPGREKGREVMAERVLPLFRETATLRSQLSLRPHDLQRGRISLRNGFTLYLGFSGSPAALASHPIRNAVLDEVDKYTEQPREAPPVELARQRLKTFWGNPLAALWGVSTPTVANGTIHQERRACAVQLRYYVPCPYCGAYQVLRHEQLRYADALPEESALAHAERVASQEELAWIECSACGMRIRAASKRRMVQRGCWAHEGLDPREIARHAPAAGMGGVILAGWPPGRSVGVHISELPCLWAPWHSTAAAWIAAQGRPGALAAFWNSRMGEPVHETVARPDAAGLARKLAAGHPRGVAPRWTLAILASCDVQLDRAYIVVRAWGPMQTSRRIWHGYVPLPREDPRGWNILYDHLLGIEWAVEGGENNMPVRLAGIDARYRSAEVWDLVRRDQRLRGMLGSPRPLGVPVKSRPGEYQPPGRGRRRRIAVWRHYVDTELCKDMLHAALTSRTAILGPPPPAPGPRSEHAAEREQDVWQLDCDPDERYLRHMASEHKVALRQGRGRVSTGWEPISEHAENHYWDCEALQFALHYMARVDSLAVEELQQAGGAANFAARRVRRSRV